MAAVWEVLSYLIVEFIATYMLQFWDIVFPSHNRIRGEWRFNIMIDSKIFSISNWLDFLKKASCLSLWQEGIQPLGIEERLVTSANWPGKKASEKATDRMRNPHLPTMEQGKKEVPVVSPAMGTTVPVLAEKKSSPSLRYFSFANNKGFGYHREVKGQVAESRKRWDEDPNCRTLVLKSFLDRHLQCRALNNIRNKSRKRNNKNINSRSG